MQCGSLKKLRGRTGTLGQRLFMCNHTRKSMVLKSKEATSTHNGCLHLYGFCKWNDGSVHSQLTWKQQERVTVCLTINLGVVPHTSGPRFCLYGCCGHDLDTEMGSCLYGQEDRQRNTNAIVHGKSNTYLQFVLNNHFVFSKYHHNLSGNCRFYSIESKAICYFSGVCVCVIKKKKKI